jgi:hypothetical protein
LPERETQSSRSAIRVKRHSVVALEPPANSIRVQAPLAQIAVCPTARRILIQVGEEIA